MSALFCPECCERLPAHLPECPEDDGDSVSEAKHTPGPWTQCDTVVVVTPETHGFATWLANCHVGGNSRAEQMANAKLIAAAPDLLGALQAIASMPTESDEWDAVEKYGDCREIARAAIAKATGSAA